MLEHLEYRCDVQDCLESSEKFSESGSMRPQGRKFFLISCTIMLLVSVSEWAVGSSLEASSSPAGMSQNVYYLHGRQASEDGRFEAAIKHLLKLAQTDSMN